MGTAYRAVRVDEFVQCVADASSVFTTSNAGLLTATNMSLYLVH